MYTFRVKFTGHEWLLQRKIFFFIWDTVAVTHRNDVAADWLYDFEVNEVTE